MPDLTSYSLAELRDMAPINNAAFQRILDEIESGDHVSPFQSYADRGDE